MAVGPAHGGLDGQVQPVEPDVERHLDPAQDRGGDIVEGDLEPGDRGGAHAATLRRSIMTQSYAPRKCRPHRTYDDRTAFRSELP